MSTEATLDPGACPMPDQVEMVNPVLPYLRQASD